MINYYRNKNFNFGTKIQLIFNVLLKTMEIKDSSFNDIQINLKKGSRDGILSL